MSVTVVENYNLEPQVFRKKFSSASACTYEIQRKRKREKEQKSKNKNKHRVSFVRNATKFSADNNFASGVIYV